MTNNPRYTDCQYYTVCGTEESLEMLDSLKVIGFDTETEGLDCHTKRLLSMQFGCADWQVVVDCLTVDPLLYKDILESSDKLFLGWNLKFDLKFLFNYGIVPRNCWDGMLAERLLWLGYPRGTHSMSLKAAGERYLGLEMDKTVRGQIIWKGLTDDVIVYAAEDVRHLERLMLKQREELRAKDLLKAAGVENRFLLPLSYMEWCGVGLDTDKWLEKMRVDNGRLENARKALDDWLVNSFVYGCAGMRRNVTAVAVSALRDKYVLVDRQGDLFTGYDLAPKVTLNWNSGPQVTEVLHFFGIDTGEKDSIDAKVLGPQKDKCPMIPLLLEYREAQKIVGTYGDNVLRQVRNGRLYTSFQQLGSDTTRITSGGKDKTNRTEYVNLLNMPADAQTRACFVAKPGNCWISIDYSG